MGRSAGRLSAAMMRAAAPGATEALARSCRAKTIVEFSQIYERLVEGVQKAAAARAHFEQSHSGTLNELAQRIASSLADVTSQRQRSADGSAATVQLSRAIGQRVMTAVMALQVGDATRQRVEHIEAALSSVNREAPAVLGRSPARI